MKDNLKALLKRVETFLRHVDVNCTDEGMSTRANDLLWEVIDAQRKIG